jgi:hypothetical protein
MMFPLVADLAADGVSVKLTCGVLRFSRQAFYKWRARPCSDRDFDDAYLTNALVDLHAEDPEFGYRFLADELETAGHELGERRVWRLCRDQALWSTTTRKGRQVRQRAARPRRSRRPRTTRLHRHCARPGVTDQHHRTPNLRREDLLLCGQGRVLEPDRRLLDR